MKWYHIFILLLYGLPALYLLYMGILNTYVYFANKNLGYEESFSVAARYLGGGGILLGFAALGWYIFRQENSYKILSWIVYLPFILVLIYVLYFALIFMTNGGKWN